MAYISSVQYTGAGTANSGSTSITVPAGAKLCVLSWSGYDANDPDWPNPMTGGVHSLGGSNFTFPNTAADATEFYFASALGYIIDPPTGSQTFSWNHKGSNTFAGDGQCFNFAFYDDVVSGVRASAGANDSTLSSGSPISTGSIASQSGDLLVAECGAYQDTPSADATFTWGGGVTQRDDVFSGGSGNLSFADMYATGAHTLTCYTNGGQDGTIAAIAFIVVDYFIRQQKAGEAAGSGYSSIETGATAQAIEAGNTLIAYLFYGGSPTIGLSDVSGSNDSWTKCGSTLQFGASSYWLEMYRLENAAAGVLNLKATFTGSTANDPAIVVYEIANLGAFDKVTGQAQTNPGTSANAISSGSSGTLSTSPEAVFSFSAQLETLGTLTVGAGFSGARSSPVWYYGGSNWTGLLEHKQAGSTSAVTGTFTDATSGAAASYATFVATFAIGSAAPPPTTTGLGWFELEASPVGWFAAEASPPAWFTPELVVTLAGNVYGVSISEAATAADAIAAVAAMIAAASEAISATDAPSSAAVLAAALSEAASSSDSISGGSGTYAVDVSEAASAGDSASSSAVFPRAPGAEAITAGDSVSSAGVYPRSPASEAVTAGDSVSSSATLAGALTEAASATESMAAVLLAVASISEAATAGELLSSGAGPSTYPVDISEAITAAELVASALVTGRSISEAASAGDSVTIATFAAAGAIAEAITAGHSHGAQLVGVAGLLEAISALESLLVFGVGNVSITEAISAADAVSTQAIVGSPVKDRTITLRVRDSLVTVEIRDGKVKVRDGGRIM